MAHAGKADLHGLHRTFDRAAHVFLCDAVVGKDLGLSLRSCSAVAAHRGDDIGFRPLGFDKIHNRTRHNGIVADAAAAAGDGDLHAGLDLAAQRLAGQLSLDGSGDFLLGDMGAVKYFTDFDHFGDRDILNQVGNNFHSKILLPRFLSSRTRQTALSPSFAASRVLGTANLQHPVPFIPLWHIFG